MVSVSSLELYILKEIEEHRELQPSIIFDDDNGDEVKGKYSNSKDYLTYLTAFLKKCLTFFFLLQGHISSEPEVFTKVAWHAG